ncbi:MAG: aspartate/glutamate racemase family protein [Bacteroidales bacterium]
MNKPGCIGILGGMGPEATSCLFNLIIKNTPASTDQEHVPVIIYNNPLIPDRTRHLVYGEESPLKMLTTGALILENAGATLIIIACNTAHYYINDILPHINIPILNMIDLTSEYIYTTMKESGRIKAGILASTGTIRSGLYQKSLESFGIEPVLLPAHLQEELVMEAVYGKSGIKAGYKREPEKLLGKAVKILNAAGAHVIIEGCTEIPIVLREKHSPVPLVNSMEILAKAAIKLVKIR